MVKARRALIVIGLLFAAAPVFAQAREGWVLSIYANDAQPGGTALATVVLPIDTVTCGLEKMPGRIGIVDLERAAGTSVVFAFDDADDDTKQCATPNINAALLQVTDRLPPAIYNLGLQRVQVSPVDSFVRNQVRKPATGICTSPMPGRQTVLAVTVNTAFPLTVKPAGKVDLRFEFAYTYPVVYAEARVDGVALSKASGEDLHGVSGLLFYAPSALGNHQVTVYARDAAGCEYTSGATRTLRVQ